MRGGRCEVVEGKRRARNVLREFPDYATALACYRSPEYQRAKPLRAAAFDLRFPDRRGLRRRAAAVVGDAARRRRRKGYWIAHVDVTDPEGYKAYMAANTAAVRQIRRALPGARRPREVVEGKVRARTVVLEFPSYQAALACYRSPEYQAAMALRKGKADGRSRRHRGL